VAGQESRHFPGRIGGIPRLVVHSPTNPPKNGNNPSFSAALRRLHAELNDLDPYFSMACRICRFFGQNGRIAGNAWLVASVPPFMNKVIHRNRGYRFELRRKPPFCARLTGAAAASY
jgi:hypothetical protein